MINQEIGLSGHSGNPISWFRAVHIRFIEGMYLHEFVQNG